MPKPSLRILENLSVALEKMQRAPDLTQTEAEWLHQFASRLITESSLRTPETEMPTRA